MNLQEAIERTIARQEADKKRLSRIIASGQRKSRNKAITQADVRQAVRSTLEDVARELRFKAKETPGWAAAYHSACAVIESKLDKLN